MTNIDGSQGMAVGDGVVSGVRHIHRRVSWSALLGGVVLVIAVQLLLSLLGAAIGLHSVNVNAGSTPSGESFKP